MLRQLNRGLLILAYLGCLALFLTGVGKSWSPEHGWTGLIRFGSFFEARSLDALKQVPHAVWPDSHGYDGQFYAQLALSPTLADPQLPSAIDNIAYRSRRILFSWTAWALGLGKPNWVLQAYALQNVLFWLLTAGWLLYWLPPTSWFNFFRWAGIMLSAGWLDSVHHAVLDGPALFLMLLAIWLTQQGWRFGGAAVLGLSLLGKETNLLAGPSLLEKGGFRQDGMASILLRTAILLAPLLVWLGVVFIRFGLNNAAGSRNFDLPLAGWLAKIEPMRRDIESTGWQPYHTVALACLIATWVQIAHALSCWSWTNLWWRLALPQAVLGMCLGIAVTEGYPGAFVRVLLPLQVAFNLSLQPNGVGWLLLLAGNLSVARVLA